MSTKAKHLAAKPNKPHKQKSRTPVIIAIVTVIVIALLILFLFTPVLDGLKPGKQLHLKIGHSKFDYPPLHYYDNGKLVGFDIELAQAAAEIMGAEIEFVPINWSEAAEALESGDVDMLWGGLERASLDEQIVKFTKSYLQANIVLLMPGDRDYSKLQDLQGLSICALNFTPAFSYLQAYNRDVIKSKRSFTPPEYQALLNSLSSGEFDCMITDINFASFFLKQNSGESYAMSDVVIGASYAIGVLADEPKLFDRLQSALDELQANGTVDTLREKWIGS